MLYDFHPLTISLYKASTMAGHMGINLHTLLYEACLTFEPLEHMKAFFQPYYS